MAHLISIGNSKGVRLPKNLIAEAKLEEKELEFKVVPEGILIHPVSKAREGWKEKFESMSNQPLSVEEQEWLETDLSSSREDDWTW